MRVGVTEYVSVPVKDRPATAIEQPAIVAKKPMYERASRLRPSTSLNADLRPHKQSAIKSAESALANLQTLVGEMESMISNPKQADVNRVRSKPQVTAQAKNFKMLVRQLEDAFDSMKTQMGN